MTTTPAESLPEQAERAVKLLADAPSLPIPERLLAHEAILKFQMDAILTLLHAVAEQSQMTEEALKDIVHAVNVHSQALRTMTEPKKAIITLDQFGR